MFTPPPVQPPLSSLCISTGNWSIWNYSLQWLPSSHPCFQGILEYAKARFYSYYFSFKYKESHDECATLQWFSLEYVRMINCGLWKKKKHRGNEWQFQTHTKIHYTRKFQCYKNKIFKIIFWFSDHWKYFITTKCLSKLGYYCSCFNKIFCRKVLVVFVQKMWLVCFHFLQEFRMPIA